MFQEEVRKRLELLEGDLVLCSDKNFHLREKRKEGEADLVLSLKNPCILFQKLEEKKLDYFKNKKCADFILYEQKQEIWRIHIFELKRSIGEKAWEIMKMQFCGAMQNALAIAGFLNIPVDMDHITVYSAYRNDKINDTANPARLRLQMHQRIQPQEHSDHLDWNNQRVKLDFLGKETFLHCKIQLNIENGHGEYVVS